MKVLLKKRNDLKLILMSSLPEMTLFQDYFNSYNSIIEIEMKQNDIRMIYLENNNNNDDKQENNNENNENHYNNNNYESHELVSYENILKIIELNYEEGKVNVKVLIFLPDVNSIMLCKEELNNSKYKDKYEIELLHISFF